MKEIVIQWLNKQLRKKSIALHIATNKPNPSEEEIKNIKDTIIIIEYLLELTEAAP